jgi:NTE family protein
MATVALVLGAGGLTGGAWMCGALGALADVAGWDARRADLVVGTSAGARVGATLRLGISATDHHAGAVGAPFSDEFHALAGGVDLTVTELPRPVRPSGTAWLPGAPRLTLRGLGRLPNPRLLSSGLLPRGSAATACIGDGIRALPGGDAWPERPTWMCAIRAHDGRRVVFGRDLEATPSLATAVEASAAVPGWFAPVTVDGIDHVDGGADSPSNADVVAGLGFDLAVVLSPMTAIPSVFRSRPAAHLVIRSLHAQILSREVGAIRRAGTPVLTLQPTADDLAAMGRSSLDGTNIAAIAATAYESVQRRLDDPRLDELVAVLDRATARSAAP